MAHAYRRKNLPFLHQFLDTIEAGKVNPEANIVIYSFLCACYDKDDIKGSQITFLINGPQTLSYFYNLVLEFVESV